MEFGSDFHLIKQLPEGKPLFDLLETDYRLYVDGRQALEMILIIENIKSLWLPSYYCYESVEGIIRKGYNVNFYPCTPEDNVESIINGLNLSFGDAVVIMNYFGFQRCPHIQAYDYIMIEDHSHDLTSDWALKSEADWCFASLRKTLPIPDGGILWSPRKRHLPKQPLVSPISIENSERRYAAMSLKTDFLNGGDICKTDYLSEFRVTEERFDSLPVSAMSHISKNIISHLDIIEWYSYKKRNWILLRNIVNPSDKYRIFGQDFSGGTPFSFILLFENHNQRNAIRKFLIENNVFPAILWPIRENLHQKSQNFGNKILSIHCDGRYTQKDIEKLANVINNC